MKDKRFCKSCYEYFPPEKMAKNRLNKEGNWYYRGSCKSCHNERNKHDQKEKALDKNPENYMQCDECCYIWHKSRGNECKKCTQEKE